MNHQVRSRFRVRSYEVDSYGHLNNGVYVNLFEQGRLDYLMSLGFSYDGFAERQEWIVVGRTEVVFRKPVHSGNELVVVSEVEGLGRTSARFDQRMYIAGVDGLESGEIVCQANTLMVFSGVGGGSTPIPDDFRAAVEAGIP